MYIYYDFIPFIHVEGIEELANEQTAKVSLSLLDFTENHELTFRIGKSHKRLMCDLRSTVHCTYTEQKKKKEKCNNYISLSSE